ERWPNLRSADTPALLRGFCDNPSPSLAGVAIIGADLPYGVPCDHWLNRRDTDLSRFLQQPVEPLAFEQRRAERHLAIGLRPAAGAHALVEVRRQFSDDAGDDVREYAIERAVMLLRAE